MAKGGLGAGLDSLFSDNSSEVQVKTTLRISEIEPNRDQPRKYFSEEAINTLAESIRIHGMLQPILVRPLPSGNYQIVAGERRWRAAKRIGLAEIPVSIREMSDVEMAQIAIIENLQRENLNPIEEANGYKELIEKYNMTQERVSELVGKSRSAISNLIRILSLPGEVQEMIKRGDLSVSHARALLAFDDQIAVVALAEKVCDGKITVRQLEKLGQSNDIVPHDVMMKGDRYFREAEVLLTSRLGRKVKVECGKKKGTLTIEFYDKEDFNSIAEKLLQD